MTIEEKSKAYDEAIEKIKYVLGHGVSPVLNKEDLQDIFPELKESEDERIRKELISLVENWKIFNPNSPFDEHPVYTSDKDTVDKILAWIEKQGEKKPALSEEDEEHIDSLLKRLDGLCRNEFERTRFAISEDKDWLKSLKQRIGG